MKIKNLISCGKKKHNYRKKISCQKLRKLTSIISEFETRHKKNCFYFFQFGFK